MRADLDRDPRPLVYSRLERALVWGDTLAVVVSVYVFGFRWVAIIGGVAHLNIMDQVVSIRRRRLGPPSVDPPRTGPASD